MKGVRKIATTGIWKIEKRLDNVIDYTTNIEKTINSDYGKDNYYDLHNVIDYVEADYKTEKQFYVSGVNCNPKTALEEMTITKEQYGKTGGILGFHAFQSFAEGEVTPEQCHAIGVRLAEEMWGDRFEVVVSTHLNTNHYHNHFVINSVSFKDGKRYYDKRETYAELRRLNIGCLVTSIAILIEKSGVPTPNIELFNPGTFVEALNKNGGFDERGNLYYGPISKVVPNFKYVGNVNLRGKSRSEKLALITQYVNAGYFITEEVKGATPGNQHWVAVTGVNGNNVIMVDPASNQTDMWSAYEWSKSSQFNYFKAE